MKTLIYQTPFSAVRARTLCAATLCFGPFYGLRTLQKCICRCFPWRRRIFILFVQTGSYNDHT
ncbi:hypothetical protein PSAB6_360072 [Paraburkholderia sabiae]|nr:hypothetical protein PSAB6_360072 [Paraburkholderia sabiae]